MASGITLITGNDIRAHITDHFVFCEVLKLVMLKKVKSAINACSTCRLRQIFRTGTGR